MSLTAIVQLDTASQGYVVMEQHTTTYLDRPEVTEYRSYYHPNMVWIPFEWEKADKHCNVPLEKTWDDEKNRATTYRAGFHIFHKFDHADYFMEYSTMFGETFPLVIFLCDVRAQICAGVQSACTRDGEHPVTVAMERRLLHIVSPQKEAEDFIVRHGLECSPEDAVLA